MSDRKTSYAVAIAAFIAWFAVVAQYVLMLENRVAPVLETTIRFFSFFTILSNTLVACYFSGLLTKKLPWSRWVCKKGVLTAITVYILVVGLVYQLVLRRIWQPEGLQLLVDELLHSVIPLYVLLFWFWKERAEQLPWKYMLTGLIYPFTYLFFILIRGSAANFYPYPFLDLNQLPWQSVLSNIAALIILFVFLFFSFISLSRILFKRNYSSS
jgi:hypothetical protein